MCQPLLAAVLFLATGGYRGNNSGWTKMPKSCSMNHSLSRPFECIWVRGVPLSHLVSPHSNKLTHNMTEVVILYVNHHYWNIHIWVFPNVCLPPNHPFVDGLSIINHPFWGTFIYERLHILLEPLDFEQQVLLSGSVGNWLVLGYSTPPPNKKKHNSLPKYSLILA